jgi:hypothetical protein
MVLASACGSLGAADPDPAPAVSACPPCDDGNPCTVDSCIDLTQTCHHEPVSCDDGNSCTVDSCIQEAGGGYTCRNDVAPDQASCDDGNPCTGPDTCHSGACVGDPVAPESCDDGKPCTFDDVCDGGVCKGTPSDPGSYCDDMNGCTLVDTCTADGNCVGRALNAGDACDDGNLCTRNDRCSDSPAGIVCAGTTFCDDGNACTEDRCDAATGACSHSPVSCDDKNSCTADSCDAAAGRCQHENLTGSCDDRNGCTIDDHCSDGVCVGGGRRDCGPGSACIRWICEPSDPYGCEPQYTSDPCGPVDQCSASFCSLGRCQGQVYIGRPCQPSYPDPCNSYSCTSHGCGPDHGNFGAPCDDQNACTVQDVCVQPINGGVLAQCRGMASDCDDGNVCTADSCDPTTGCRHDPLPTPVTCGVGACVRTADACEGGAVHQCIPGAPQPEIACNLLDDDCDGLVDQNNVMATCSVRPRILRQGGLLKTFSVTCTLRDRCTGNQLLSPLGATIDSAWVSAADRLGDAGDNVTFPDPATLVCAETGPERGLAEDLAMRQADSDSVTFVFDRPWDGVCSTLDGGRHDLVTLLADLPDGALARVCVGSRYNGHPFEGCGVVRMRE